MRKNTKKWPVFHPHRFNAKSVNLETYARTLLYLLCIRMSDFVMIGPREHSQKSVTDGRLLYFLKQGYKLDLPINFIKTYKQYLNTNILSNCTRPGNVFSIFCPYGNRLCEHRYNSIKLQTLMNTYNNSSSKAKTTKIDKSSFFKINKSSFFKIDNKYNTADNYKHTNIETI